jgi:hypothetical protein
MREARYVLDPRVFRLDACIEANVPVQRPLYVVVQRRSPSAAIRVLHQPAVPGDGVRVEEILEILGLELQILVLRVRQRVLAVEGVEHAHGGVYGKIAGRRSTSQFPF